MKRSNLLMAGMLATLALFVSGCSTLRLEPPTLQVVNVGLVSASLLEQQLVVRLRVQNPNDVELPVRGVTYAVELAGESFATGESENDILVPALGNREFDVAVRANAAAAALRLLGDRGNRNPEYRITGRVKLARGVLRTIPFEHKGELRLR